MQKLLTKAFLVKHGSGYSVCQTFNSIVFGTRIEKLKHLSREGNRVSFHEKKLKELEVFSLEKRRFHLNMMTIKYLEFYHVE